MKNLYKVITVLLFLNYLNNTIYSMTLSEIKTKNVLNKYKIIDGKYQTVAFLEIYSNSYKLEFDVNKDPYELLKVELPNDKSTSSSYFKYKDLDKFLKKIRQQINN